MIEKIFEITIFFNSERSKQFFGNRMVFLLNQSTKESDKSDKQGAMQRNCRMLLPKVHLF